MKFNVKSFIFGMVVMLLITAAVYFAGAAGVIANPTTSRVFVDGEQVQVQAYNIDGFNYFRLRCFAAAVDIGVWWDAENDAVMIETDKSYDPYYTGPGRESPASARSADIVLAALGDSIAGHHGVPASHGYVELLGGMLMQSGEFSSIEVRNLAVGGYRTADMLNQLESLRIRTLLADADIITISIGGNNFLHPISSALSGAQSMADIERRLSGDGFRANAAAGIEAFRDEFPKIINAVKSIAPGAEIYVATIFNPCSKNDPIYDVIEELVAAVNSFIVQNAPGSYHVVDVYASFKALDGEGLTFLDFDTLNIDPHPNREGHRIIAEAHFEAILPG